MKQNIKKTQEAEKVCEEIFVICNNESKKRKNPAKRIATFLSEKFSYKEDDAINLAKAFAEVAKVLKNGAAPALQQMNTSERVAFIVSLVAQNLSTLKISLDRQLTLLEPFCDEMSKEVIKATKLIVETVEAAISRKETPNDSLAKASSRLGSVLGSVIDLQEDELNYRELQTAQTLSRFVKACFNMVKEKMAGYEMSITYNNTQLLDLALSLETEEKEILKTVKIIELLHRESKSEHKNSEYEQLLGHFQHATFAMAEASSRLKQSIEEKKSYH